MPNITREKFFVSLISRILMRSIAVAILFLGIRYILIPWAGVNPSWALLSIPVQFIVGWVIMQGLQNDGVEETMMCLADTSSAKGGVTASEVPRRVQASPWRPSEMRRITLPVSVQCFEKRPGGGFFPVLDWSLNKGVTVTIGHLETVSWDNNFHEVVPFHYNGFLYYLRVSDMRISNLARELRARSNLRVVK